MLRAWSPSRRSAPDARARAFRSSGRRPPSGRSSPSGSCSTIIGQRGRSRAPPLRAARLDGADLVEHDVERLRHQLMHGRGIVARDEDTARSRSRRTGSPARSRRCAPGPSGWRSCSRSDAGSAAPRRRCAGLRNLLECQEVASGPVSASPSPMTQATIEIGIVEGRAIGVRQRIAEFAALMDRARRLRRGMARDAAGKAELPEQPMHAVARPAARAG